MTNLKTTNLAQLPLPFHPPVTAPMNEQERATCGRVLPPKFWSKGIETPSAETSAEVLPRLLTWSHNHKRSG